MFLHTSVELPDYPFRITCRDTLFWTGSCFAANIGNIMKTLHFKCEVNPFGALYNPLSILDSLNLLLPEHQLTKDDLFEHGELWSSFMFHSSFSDPDCSRALEKMNRQLSVAARNLSNTQYIFITFGSAYAYRLKTSGATVGNCHKLPASHFTVARLAPTEIVDAYSELITRIAKHLPYIRFVFTLSPVRHPKYGMHGNQLSKACLMLAVEQLTKLFPDRCFYFPAYEIVLDELRDYRFYDKDLCHVSETGIEYIKNKFITSMISPQAHEIIREIDRLNLARQHRPFHANTAAHAKFLANTNRKEAELKAKYPYLDWN
ncbi:MAG: GSCFA domain-containing protein [Prevotellaceae bacterium]|jgi:hypothetical protein|nr:GSCFA domain-containing protein [Prevotellaceae bacterium]